MYIDDLCIVLKDLKALLKQLQAKPYEFKLKGSGLLNFLSCGFKCDDNVPLYMDPGCYIDCMEQKYE